jgi:hypothetical protein
MAMAMAGYIRLDTFGVPVRHHDLLVSIYHLCQTELISDDLSVGL